MKRNGILSAVVLLLLMSMSLISCASTENNAVAEPVQEDIMVYLSAKDGAMPEMMDVSAVVDGALASHEQWDGSTMHFRWGDLSGTPLYVVSLFPDLGIIKSGKEITEEELTAFIKNNYELFKDPRVCLGTWFNGQDGNTYIDINVVLADLDRALELGKEYNQIAVFNLETFEETNTGGDGKPLENLPAPIDRLPEFK